MVRAWFSNAPRLLVGLAAAACMILLGASLAWVPAARARETRLARAEPAHFTRDCHRRCSGRLARAARRTSRSAGSNAGGAIPTPVSPDFYAVNAPYLYPAYMPSSQWGVHLSGIRAAGFSSVRREIWWGEVEPQPPSGGVHSYNWQGADQFIAALASHGLRWYGSVGRGTSWASGEGGSWGEPPSDEHIPDFAAFAGALAKRYGTNGTFWQAHPELPYLPVREFEVWNEPNSPQFWPDDLSQSPARYGSMVAAATTAIHAVNPEASVVAGALAPREAPDYIGQMVQANPELEGEVSTVSFHPYGRTAEHSLDRIVELRKAIDQWLGPQVEIEVTEDGISLDPGSPHTMEDRAALWSTLALTLPRTDCKVRSFVPHEWTGPKQDPDNHAEWYGMADWTTAELDPSGVALRDAILRMEGLGPSPPPTGTVELCYG